MAVPLLLSLLLLPPLLLPMMTPPFPSTATHFSTNPPTNRARQPARAHLLIMASTTTWMGFWSVSRWMMSKAWETMRTWIVGGWEGVVVCAHVGRSFDVGGEEVGSAAQVLLWSENPDAHLCWIGMLQLARW